MSVLVPLAYFVAAHAALLVAMVAAARAPGVAMTLLHPATAGTVHLVTLGWITGAILGAVYVVGPLALRLRLAPRAVDGVALVVYVAGVSRLAAHYWMADYAGLPFSAALVWLAVCVVLGRVWFALRDAPVGPGVTLCITLACVNFAAAGALGVLLAWNRAAPILHGATPGVLYGHAHLAAVGWATLLAIGFGSRVLPMVLPARPPADRRTLLIGVSVEIGLLVLVPGLAAGSRWAAAGAVPIAAGLGLFVVEAVRMVRRRLPPNRAIRVPWIAPLHVSAAIVCLAAASALGLMLALGPSGLDVPRLGLTYGVLGLVGFLGQLIAAVFARMLPLFTWYWVGLRRGPSPPQQTPYTLPAWRGEAVSAGSWMFGTCALAAGAWSGSTGLFAAGAAAIGTAVAIGLLTLAVTTAIAFRRAPEG